MRLPLNKRVGKIIALLSLLGFLAIALLVASTYRATEETTVSARNKLTIVFQEETASGIKTSDGIARIFGDCLTGAVTSVVSSFGNVECELSPPNEEGLHTIEAVTFFRESGKILNTIPISGTRSVSPLRFSGDMKITVKFLSSGEVSVALR